MMGIPAKKTAEALGATAHLEWVPAAAFRLSDNRSGVDRFNVFVVLTLAICSIAVATAPVGISRSHTSRTRSSRPASRAAALCSVCTHKRTNMRLSA